ncbi:MAG: hypothetical protein R3174_11310 [Gammaproteobacteria bacterium]|nr:hypothetical protein [Gammaproteobacteria bacterium]
MKVRHLLLALALVFALPGPAFAGSCPVLMKKIDEALAANPDLDADTLAEIKKAREEGEKLHKDGKHDKSVEELNQALLLLGLL